MDRRGMELLERMTVAIEKLSEPPEFEVNLKPPVCPHCNTVDPVVELPYQQGGTGKLSEIVVAGTCLACRKHLWVVIESYSMHKEASEAAMEVSEKEKAGFWT